jgi:ornithine decarboxylase
MNANAALDARLEGYETGHETPLAFSTVQAAVRHNGQRTPFLLIDLELVRSKIRRFRAAIPQARLHYAIKANPHPEILRVMLEENVAFEIASAGELEILLALGVPGSEVHYNNPVKPPDHLARAARAGVAWYAIDSVGEMHKVVRAKADAQLCLRIETQNLGSDWPLVGKFGVPLTEAAELVCEARRIGADLAGVSFHVGSQCRNLDNWRLGIENAKLVFAMMRSNFLAPRLLNIGGGFPVLHTKPIPAIERIGASIRAALADSPREVRVMAEPGRYLVSDAAWLVSRVIGTADRRGTRWVYLDAGVFHGLMETAEGFEYRIRSERGGARIPCTVAGPTCDSVDVVAKDCILPAGLRTGDTIYVPNAGAYSTAYSTSFNGFPPPDTVVLQHLETAAGAGVKAA